MDPMGFQKQKPNPQYFLEVWQFAPENKPSLKESHLQTIRFQGASY